MKIVANKRMAVPLRELRRLLRIRLMEARDTIGYNLAAIRITSNLAKEHKERFHIPEESSKVDVFAGMGLGSELAAEIQKK